MVNTVRKGAEFERRIMHVLANNGYKATRSAASKGSIDVIGIHPERKIIQLIQAKNSVLGEKKAKRIAEETGIKSGIYLLAVRVIDKSNFEQFALDQYHEDQIKKNSIKINKEEKVADDK